MEMNFAQLSFLVYRRKKSLDMISFYISDIFVNNAESILKLEYLDVKN